MRESNEDLRKIMRNSRVKKGKKAKPNGQQFYTGASKNQIQTASRSHNLTASNNQIQKFGNVEHNVKIQQLSHIPQSSYHFAKLYDLLIICKMEPE